MTLCFSTLTDPLNGVAGYCAAVCCDINREEMCLDYDENGYMIQYCAAVRVSILRH